MNLFRTRKKSTEMPIIRHELLHAMWGNVAIVLTICYSVLLNPRVNPEKSQFLRRGQGYDFRGI